MSLFGIGVSPLTTPTPRRELDCFLEASTPLSSTIAGGFSVDRGGFAFGLAAGVTVGTNGDSGSLLASGFFGVFASFASSLDKGAGLSLDSFFICGGGVASSFFVITGSDTLAVNFSNTFLVTASVAAGFGSGIEAGTGAALGVGFAAAGFVAERVGIDTAAAAAEESIASTEGLAGTGEGNFSFFCVPTATVVGRFFVTLVCFLEAGAKVGDCGDFGIGTATGCCALGDETETGLLMTGLATVRVGDGDAGGGGSPSNPNNLSVKGASRTPRDGCCVVTGAVGGETGVGVVAFSTTGLLAAAADVPFAFPFRVAGEGGTYPVGCAE